MTEEPLPPAPSPKKGGGASEDEAPAGDPGSASASERVLAPPPFLGEGAGGRGSSRLIAVAGFALVAFGIWYLALRTPEPRDDLGRFQGEWRLTVADRARQFPIAVRVTGDRWTYLVGDQDQKRYAITLRPDADPKEIDLVQIGPDDQPLLEKRGGQFVPVTLRGIYTVEGGKAKVVTAPSPQPRPTTFDADDGPPVWLLDKL